MSVDAIIEDTRWHDGGLVGLADVACPAVLSHLGIAADWEISLLGCDDARIAALNADFRGKPVPTNVLSWPSQDRNAAPGQDPAPPAEPELGDIAISYDTCCREAAEQGKEFSTHVLHLLVHATLHLLGYDHINDTDAARMEGLEIEILGKLGYSDPYEV